MKVTQFILIGHFRNGQWYIPTSNLDETPYLHSDGIVRQTTRNEETNEYTGWFPTQEEAQKVLDEYNAKHPNEIYDTPTDR